MLFEPVEIYFNSIRLKYAEIDHELIQAALSDEDGEAYLTNISINETDEITHSFVELEKASKQTQPKLVSCTRIQRAKLDTLLMTQIQAIPPYLLKIDVDGHEAPIIRGAEKTLKLTSVVVVEAPLNAIIERVSLLTEMGFQIFDIVDLTYYREKLAIVDLVLVRKDLISSMESLNPWIDTKFSWEQWAPQDQKYFESLRDSDTNRT